MSLMEGGSSNMNKAYTKTTWVDSRTPVNARNMNKIENALEDLYSSAAESDQYLPGDHITIKDSDSEPGKKIISTSGDVLSTSSLTGIEYTLGEPDDPVLKTLYIVLDPSTKRLDKIMIGPTTIFKTTE